MKSEHRHELETNSLAASLATLPETLKTHSNKILTVLAIVLLVVAGIRYKRSQDAAAADAVRQSLASAWSALERVQSIGSMPFPIPDAQKQTMLDAAETDVKAAAQNVIDTADASDHAQLASAYQALGQLYWTLSIYSPIATTGPSTQPTTRPTNYLDMSRDAYQKIVTSYAEQTQPLISARFGLAAIAEEKRDWKTAREEYQKVIESEHALATDKSLAEDRVAGLDKLQNPLLLIPASQPVMPETMPTALPELTPLPSLDMGPTPAPSTQPVATPTTKPTTAPTTR